MSESPWNIKKKHAQLHCIIIKAHVLDYLLVLALPGTDRKETPTEARKRWQWEGVQVFKLFIHFPSIWWTDRHISDCVKHRSFWRLKPCFSSDHQMWYVLISCRICLGYAVTLARSKSPTGEAPLSDTAALPVRGRAVHLEALLFSFILGCCCTALCGHTGKLWEGKCWQIKWSSFKNEPKENYYYEDHLREVGQDICLC